MFESGTFDIAHVDLWMRSFAVTSEYCYEHAMGLEAACHRMTPSPPPRAAASIPDALTILPKPGNGVYDVLHDSN